MRPIAVIFGTRPEAIKLSEVIRALRARDLPVSVLCTGQHTTLLDGVPSLGEVEDLGVASHGDVAEWVAAATPPLARWIRSLHPACVVVQGDTMSAYAAAYAASRSLVPVVHVEAGVRSGSLREPWPEEILRRRISKLALLHLAATPEAAANLGGEGIDGEAISITGNPGMSALARVRIEAPPPRFLLTLHRRELTERPDFRAIIERLFAAIDASDVPWIWPVHPRLPSLPTPPHRLELAPPLSYADALGVLASAPAVLTDSGGLCEEATAFGVPCVVFRRHTDRPEAIAAGAAIRVAPPDAAAAVAAALDPASWRFHAAPPDLYGSADSAAFCADEILAFCHAP